MGEIFGIDADKNDIERFVKKWKKRGGLHFRKGMKEILAETFEDHGDRIIEYLDTKTEKLLSEVLARLLFELEGAVKIDEEAKKKAVDHVTKNLQSYRRDILRIVLGLVDHLWK